MVTARTSHGNFPLHGEFTASVYFPESANGAVGASARPIGGTGLGGL